jgi:flagellar biosynthesis GTPase FlhF
LLSTQEQQAFMSKVADMNSVDIAKQLEEIAATEEHATVYSDGGSFLPLTVWAQQGWDPEMIKETAKETDKINDARFGTLYRVAVLYKGTTGKRGMIRTTKCQVRSKAATLALTNNGSASSAIDLTSAVAAPAASVASARTPQAKTERLSSSADSSSSSQSSSSSSTSKRKKASKKDKKRSKKSKKTKKDKKSKKKNKKDRKRSPSPAADTPQHETPAAKKARLAMEKAQDKFKQQQRSAQKKFASISASKLGAAKEAVEKITSDDLFCQLPLPMQQKINDTLKSLSSYINQVKLVMDGDDDDLPFADATASEER